MAAQATEAQRIALQAAHHDGDGNDQQQPVNALRVAEAAPLQMKQSGFLVTGQLVAAEALDVAPKQIQGWCSVADQMQGLIQR